MALVGKELAGKMLNATKNGTNRDEVLRKLALSIEDYVRINTDFSFHWTGSSGNSSEVQSPKGKFVTLSIDFDLFKNSKPNNSTSAFNFMSQDLIRCFSAASYNVLDSGYITTPNLFGSSGNINSLNLTLSNRSNRFQAFEDLAEQIVSWLKSQVPSLPCVGTHASYIGQAVPQTTT